MVCICCFRTENKLLSLFCLICIKIICYWLAHLYTVILKTYIHIISRFFVSSTTEKIEVLSTGNSIFEDIPDGRSLMHIRYRSGPKREPRAPTFINYGPFVCNFDMRLVPNFFKCFWCIYKHEPPFHYLKVRKFHEWRLKNGKLKSHQIWT